MMPMGKDAAKKKKCIVWFAALYTAHTLFMFGNKKILRMRGLCLKVFMTTPFVEITSR